MQVQGLGNEGTIELESNQWFEEFPADPPVISDLLEQLRLGENETIPIGGATWRLDTPLRLGGHYISPDYELNDTLLYLVWFVNFVINDEAIAKLYNVNYIASNCIHMM